MRVLIATPAQHFHPFHAAVVLKPDLRESGSERKYFILALVDQRTKNGERGKSNSLLS
jgi:hypothetical protein